MHYTRTSGRWRRSVKRIAAWRPCWSRWRRSRSLLRRQAQATGCRTNAQVYLTSVAPASVRTEDQPVDGGTDDYQMFAGNWTSFQVGGNGLRSYTSTAWTVESNVSGSFVFNGRVAGSNCVANETTVGLARHTVAGEVWTVHATYLTGNSGRLISHQAHFRVFFVDPPRPTRGTGNRATTPRRASEHVRAPV